MAGLLSPQLEAFIEVAKVKTVHGAAEQLFVTQTAVTQRIQALEAKLRTTLFIRSRRGMQLTPEGEALLRYCMAAKELEGNALAKIQGTGTETEVQVTLSAPTSMMDARIIPSCIKIMEQFPKLLLQFDCEDLEIRQNKLRSGECDFAIVQEQDLAQEMEHKLLMPEQYVLVCSKAWKGRKLKEIIKNERIIDYDSSDTMTFEYLKQYGLFEHVQHGRHFANRTESLAKLIATGLGYTTLTKEFAKPYIDNKELYALNNGKTHDVSQVLAWYSRPEPPLYFQTIIDSIS